jgi:hypothetical protein
VATLVVPPAGAQACGHTVVLTLPGVTWSDVARYRPPQLMRVIREGSVGSMSVRTIDARTSYADGFATIGAGARIQGGLTAGGIAFGSTVESPQHVIYPPQLFQSVAAAGTPEMRILAKRAGYGAEPGALGAVLESHSVSISAIGNADTGLPPSLAAGFGKWPLLAAMDRTGRVLRAGVSANYLMPASRPFRVVTNPTREDEAIDAALNAPCSVVVADGGDLIRADLNALVSGHRRPGVVRTALAESDALLAHIEKRLEPERDLLLIVSPTSPALWPAAHLGVAIAVGPGFPPGTTLESASTRRAGFVTLPDVAPTVLTFRHVKEPSVMDGQPWYAVAGKTSGRMAAAVAADDEAAFVDRVQPGISTAFVAFQVSVYFVALLLVARRERKRTPAPAPDVFRLCLEVIVLSVVAFPAATYLAGVVEAHRLGAWGLVTLLIAIDAALLAAVTVTWKNPLDRLLALTALTAGVLITDLFFGAPLELSTVFGYSPIVAGRFAGIGNIGFAVLASSSVLTGALVVHRWRGSRSALIFAAALFGVTVVADGLPALGSDVGGVIALVPALIVTWVLLAGKRPTLRTVLVAIVAVGLALALFLVFDLSRPAANQTHLARLFDDFRARGASAISDTVGRKVRANLQVFRSSVWTLSVPPAVAALAWLLLRPRGRWQLLVETYPRLRAGLVGALLVGLLGFAANDSGIIIPAVMLAFFVPLAVLLHLSLMDREVA